MKPRLYIFSGLPASGKSTLAKLLATKTNSFYLRIDTVEQALRELCDLNVQGEGYRLSYRVAADNLKLKMNVIADSCNPWHLTRQEWQNIAMQNNADFINIEVVCSNLDEHKQRAENRISEVDGLKLPSWKEIQSREYHAWTDNVLLIDTANKTVDESFSELIKLVTQFSSAEI
jgi:predicted kinase